MDFDLQSNSIEVSVKSLDETVNYPFDFTVDVINNQNLGLNITDLFVFGNEQETL